MKLPDGTSIVSLPYTGKEPCIYWGKRGFGMRVYPSGSRKFVVSYRASGKKRLLTLGEYPSMSRDRAEDLAASYRLQVSEGADPVYERRVMAYAETQAPKPQVTSQRTVSALCDTYLRLHAANKRSGYSDERLVERFVRPAWGKLRAKAVMRAHIALLHAEVSKKTPGQANRLLAIVKTMWKKAMIWGLVPEGHPNPAFGVQMNKETPRERFVTPAELPRLVSAIEQEADFRIRGVLWLYLLTGARKSELLNAKWVDVDRDRRELRIPKPKQGRPHVYPLTVRAIEILDQLPKDAGNPYLILGDKRGQHLVNISKPWNRVRARSGLADVRLHDIRRSVGSWLAMSGHSLIEIGKVLGHSSQRTTQIYARLTDASARLALESHADRMLEVLAQSNSGEPNADKEAVQLIATR